jgi:hypothetical protein
MNSPAMACGEYKQWTAEDLYLRKQKRSMIDLTEQNNE